MSARILTASFACLLVACGESTDYQVSVRFAPDGGTIAQAEGGQVPVIVSACIPKLESVRAEIRNLRVPAETGGVSTKTVTLVSVPGDHCDGYLEATTTVAAPRGTEIELEVLVAGKRIVERASLPPEPEDASIEFCLPADAGIPSLPGTPGVVDVSIVLRSYGVAVPSSAIALQTLPAVTSLPASPTSTDANGVASFVLAIPNGQSSIRLRATAFDASRTLTLTTAGPDRALSPCSP